MNIFMKKIKPILIILLFISIISCEKDDSKINNNTKVPIYKKVLSDTILIDIDSNRYKIVSINDKKWMAENLRVTHYRNGDTIPCLKSNYEWANAEMGGYSFYKNDSTNLKIFGNIYIWNTIEWGDVCPEGWHIPNNADWEDLQSAMGGSGVAGGKLKGTGTDYWVSPNSRATDSVGFNALPGGIRNGVGTFNRLYYSAYFISSSTNGTEVYIMGLRNDDAGSLLGSYHCFGIDGYYIRCIKD